VKSKTNLFPGRKLSSKWIGCNFSSDWKIHKKLNRQSLLLLVTNDFSNTVLKFPDGIASQDTIDDSMVADQRQVAEAAWFYGPHGKASRSDDWMMEVQCS
jgi:hypothetical protein